MGLLVLYGSSSLITYTSHFEKVTNTLKRYCYADYNVRASLFSGGILESEFYRERYKERLSSLFGDSFDDREKKETQAFFMKEGLLYDVWQEKNRNSYLLAQVIEKGRRKAEVPEEVIFDYLILGKKKIVPFPEYDEGREARVFVSAAERVAYIHMDSIYYHLSGYFDSLWQSDTRTPRGFYSEWAGHKDPYTYFLYRDLKEVCEYIFQKRPYRNKKEAKQFFMEEGMKIYLPTMFAMGGRMIVDQDSSFRSDYQYLRACLTGLSLNPNFTMFYLLKTRTPNSYHPLVRKGWEDFEQSFDIKYLDQITLGQISKVSQRILEKVKNHQSFRLVRGNS
jgi:hypothetical protein